MAVTAFGRGDRAPLTAAQNPADLTRVPTTGDDEAQSPRADLAVLGDHAVLWPDDPLWRSAACGSRDSWYWRRHAGRGNGVVEQAVGVERAGALSPRTRVDVVEAR